MVAKLPSTNITFGFEPTFNRMMQDTKRYSCDIWDKNKESGAMYSFTASLGTTLLTVPIELFAAVENMLKLPLLSITLCLEVPIATVGYTARWLEYKDFGQNWIDIQENIPGFKDLATAMYKAVGLVIGSLFTLTIGMLSTYVNYEIHTNLALICSECFPMTKETPAPVPCNHQEEITKLNDQLRLEKEDLQAKKSSLVYLNDQLKKVEQEKNNIVEQLTTLHQRLKQSRTPPKTDFSFVGSNISRLTALTEELKLLQDKFIPLSDENQKLRLLHSNIASRRKEFEDQKKALEDNHNAKLSEIRNNCVLLYEQFSLLGVAPTEADDFMKKDIVEQLVLIKTMFKIMQQNTENSLAQAQNVLDRLETTEKKLSDQIGYHA